MKYKGSDRDFYNGALIRYHSENWGGISLGAFIIMNNARGLVQTNDTRIHEYGHTIQSLILGPFYLLVIGIPSFIWCNNKRFIEMRKKGISYFSFYPERWANYLGELTTKEKLSPDSH
ncbi:MAG: hypothetical protein LBF68_07095 [Christensenellaceae bacterium]|nr:hypothetical protein [Christensenellaceae bacterium]